MAEAARLSETDQKQKADEHQTAPQSEQGKTAEKKSGGQPATATAKAEATGGHGGKDELGQKEELLRPFFEDMKAVAAELAPLFTSMGLHFRPEILLATAMQEAANHDPLTARSFDNGLGIMQITPYKGQLDGKIAAAIGWDNSKDIETNIKNSKWRDARANITAGGYELLGKARSLKILVPSIWSEMDEKHKWRAVMFAYNAGEGTAMKALKQGGPTGPMISTFTSPNGRVVSHDYTAEVDRKLDYVDGAGHDPFGGGAAQPQTAEQTSATQDHAPATEHKTHKQGPSPQQDPSKHPLHGSVGQGGANAAEDVRKVQSQLKRRGVDPGAIDGQIGPHTVSAIRVFQSTFMSSPDGLIEVGHGTEKSLFQGHGKVSPPKTEETEHHASATQQAGQTTAPTAGHEGKKKDDAKQVKSEGLSRIEPNVKLTSSIEAAWRVLLPYLPAGAEMTSGLRSDEDQANLINRYYTSHGGTSQDESVEQKREWLQGKGMIIARVGSSPHRTGLAFDISGASLGSIQASIIRCHNEKKAEFKFLDTIIERANNCIHVNLSG